MFPVAFADESAGNWEVGILVCQCDITSLLSKQYKKQKSINETIGNKTTEQVVEVGDELTADISHAFLGLGEYMYIINNILRTLRVKFKATYGFGSRPVDGHLVEFEPVCEPEVGPFTNLKCEVLLSIYDLNEEYIRTANSSTNLAIGYKWAEATNTMDNAKGYGYNLYSHNCFTVARKAARAIGGRNETISNMGKANFGIGTEVTGVLGKSRVLSVASFRGLGISLNELAKGFIYAIVGMSPVTIAILSFQYFMFFVH
ncbi:MAG: hypothetical protein LBB44_03795 [Endomicrobium sp.]|nr:hypothetical protein [Endomicrobium sp.]